MYQLVNMNLHVHLACSLNHQMYKVILGHPISCHARYILHAVYCLGYAKSVKESMISAVTNVAHMHWLAFGIINDGMT